MIIGGITREIERIDLSASCEHIAVLTERGHLLLLNNEGDILWRNTEEVRDFSMVENKILLYEGGSYEIISLLEYRRDPVWA